MHHIEDTQAVLTELSTMLCAGGTLMIFDLLHEPGAWDFHSEHSHKHGGVHHGHGFTQDELIKQLTTAGLSETHAVNDFKHAKPAEEGAPAKEHTIVCAWGSRPVADRRVEETCDILE